MLTEKPWTLEAMLRLLVGIFLCMFIVVGAMGLLQGFTGKKLDEGSSLAVVMGTLVVDGSILLMVGWLIWWQRVGWWRPFGLRHHAAYAIVLGVLVGLAFFPLGLSLQTLCQFALHALRIGTHEEQAVEMLRNAQPGWLRVYLAVFAVGIAPVAEETVFRGVIYPTIKQAGFPRLALWGNSLIFGLIHTNLAAFIPLTVLALILTWLYEKTDNLLANITAHATFNAANLVLMFVAEHGQNSPF
jgi:membrane protease YdiL (CAAX protease family)